MTVSEKIIQKPAPGTHILAFRGDSQTFSLSLAEPERGSAWLRTNLGHAETKKDEIIRNIVDGEPRMNHDWFDIPMKRLDGRRFAVTLALLEAGHFEAKGFFLPEDRKDPVWPAGENITINIEPADTCCANIIYNAFVRQFGPNKAGKQEHGPWINDAIRELDHSGYTVIPPSGTFRQLIKELDFIIGELGCRIILLLPIHPTPTTYARMGRFGSPYAALSFTTVDPALAEFDPAATPMEQFVELIDAVHERGGKIFIDIAINHTGWAAGLHNTHPEWLVRDREGNIEAPGAWGVVWADLTRLDYSHKGLWQYMAQVFLSWCRRGVDGFRCDAGYMIPVPAWRFIAAAVRRQFPDTVFLLEGLGGRISTTRDILNIANLNWAYSELFQNYDRGQIEHYLPLAIQIAREDGVMIHFAETHDNPRLAERSKTYARMRTALCALCSQHGGFGFANGVEWFATEKIDVHEANSLNWGAEENQVPLIQRLNQLLREHPAFHDRVRLSMVQQGDGNFIVLLRHHGPSGRRLLVAVNLDADTSVRAQWALRATEMAGPVFMDLLTGQEVDVSVENGVCGLVLAPGQVLCLTDDQSDPVLSRNPPRKGFSVPGRIVNQGLRAKAMEVYRFYHGNGHLGDFDPDQASRELAADPAEYCRSLNVVSGESRVITWQWPRDRKREVMIPPDHFLLVQAWGLFRAEIVQKREGRDVVLAAETALQGRNGSYFCLFMPLLSDPKAQHRLELNLTVYGHGDTEHAVGHLLFLPVAERARVRVCFSRSELPDRRFLLLGTNGRGGMLRAHVAWGKLSSKYDALLAANLSPEYPEDRWIMFSRCRAWVVFQGYSTEISMDCLDWFRYEDNFRGCWRYAIPCGQGQHILLTVTMEMARGENAVRILFHRHPAGGKSSRLADARAICIILRPDIEDRNFHETTKAYLGPEHAWPDCVTAGRKGFVFAPDAHRLLEMHTSAGEFVSEPEWYYMVYHKEDAERGLDPHSDLFSPGYFHAPLEGGETLALTAHVRGPEAPFYSDWEPIPAVMTDSGRDIHRVTPLAHALMRAMDAFIVRRGSLNTVIAGYPWFLDWGRDTLIFVRGLIAAGRTDTARSILEQFARFEDRGTLANMIRGEDAGNRDTSDAPLWFFVACSDVVNAENDETFLDIVCNGRTIRIILISMGRSMIAGTPNGIRMDPVSGLIFSPAHFTWMDTNHPAGTPREGYPIEIQALWYFALSFLARIDRAENRAFWQQKAVNVRNSITDLFVLKEKGFLSDCLHAHSGKPADQARPDDALRPNQLFAITLGAVTDRTLSRSILSACEELLVPGAIRSLADREVCYPLPVFHNGEALNDPIRPYQGVYSGDEDTERKPAYHNGTAWTWLFPSYCEAWVRAYGDEGKAAARAWLASATEAVDTGCVGQVPEIMDGDYPHTQRGCDAQAWGVSELLRVWIRITGQSPAERP
ncbi:MAG: glycogen debranching protein [Deltaproteobacteria bacterium]|nr:MAG: glycogen debranching protein [Deltaproteobacteria bacterium]